MHSEGTGYEIPLLSYLEWQLAKYPPPASQTKILLKLALDNATMTAGKRMKQELAGFEMLYDGTCTFCWKSTFTRLTQVVGTPLSSVKSPDNCHVWLIYIGMETEEVFKHLY